MVVDSTLPIIAERAMYFGASWAGGHESAGVTAPATSWFHAEGATGEYFDTYILVANPNATDATVTFTYLLPSGSTVTKVHRMQPNSRLTVNVETEDSRLANTAVSTTVTADVPVVSERAMYWPGPFTTWTEAHNSFGLSQTGTRWALAEGRVGGTQGFETFLLLANPGPTEGADVRVTFLRQDAPPVTKNYTVGPNSRFNVYANGVAELQDEHFGALVESINGVPIVVERAMYWNTPGQTWAGGTNATAVRVP